MKINEPLTPEDHDAADEEHRRLAQGQKDKLRDMADAVLRGDDLSALDRELVAGALRFVANGIPAERPGPKTIKKIPEEARAFFAMKVAGQGKSENTAIEELAERYQASTTAIKKVLGKAGPHGEARRRAKKDTDSQLAFARHPGVTLHPKSG